jgi:rhamnulokinase
VRQAQQLSGRPIQTLHVVGGGSRNELLCQLTADATQLPVTAGPVEATAIGNLLVQARVIGGLTGDLNTLREVVRRSEPLRHYTPDLQTAHAWEKADADLLNRTEE